MDVRGGVDGVPAVPAVTDDVTRNHPIPRSEIARVPCRQVRVVPVTPIGPMEPRNLASEASFVELHVASLARQNGVAVATEHVLALVPSRKRARTGAGRAPGVSPRGRAGDDEGGDLWDAFPAAESAPRGESVEQSHGAEGPCEAVYRNGRRGGDGGRFDVVSLFVGTRIPGTTPA